MTRPLTLRRVTWANLAFRPLTAAFNLMLLAMGVAIVLTLTHLDDRIARRFDKDLRGIDMVVSGKGSPLQIILSSVFQIDVPTGNIPLAEADALTRNPLVKSAIPLAMGDNYNGYRIVGTTPDYIAHYGAAMAQGHMYAQPMEAVTGSEVASRYGLHLGSRIVGAHGLVNSDDLHTDFPYIVTGILNPTGGVIDRLVLTPVESVWHVHAVPDPDDPEEAAYKKTHPADEITAMLLTYKSPYAAAVLPRLIAKSGSMQGASPAFEVARLKAMMGMGTEALAAFGILLTGFAAFSLFITLTNAVNERAPDIALMRCLGATRRRIFSLILCEVLTLTISGCACGFVLSRMFLYATACWLAQARHIRLDTGTVDMKDARILAAALAIGVLAGIAPAMRAYRFDIVKTLVKA